MSKRSHLTVKELAFVQQARVARLGTADEHGMVYLVPVCYAYDGSQFYTPLDEKPKSVDGTQLRRVRNIQLRHTASLLIDQYSDDWSHLGYIFLQGQAGLIEPDTEQHAQALLLLRARYVQYQTMKLELQPVITIIPDHITAWGPALTSD